MTPRTQCVPLPLVGRGWGWGSCDSFLGGAIVNSTHHPPPQPSPTRGEGAHRVRRSAGSTSRECALTEMLLEKRERQRQRALRLRLRVGLAAVARERVVGTGIFVDRHQRIG